MNWPALENALQAWVKAATGLAGDHVVFADQAGAPKPSRSFLTITLGALRPVGLDDSEELVVEGTPDAGEEIEIRAGGPRELVVSVAAYSAETLGASAAKAVLSQVQAALALPSVMDAFDGAGCSCFDAGRVLNTTTVLDSAQEGRALLECRFYVNESVSEFAGYIAHVQVLSSLFPTVVVP